MEPLPDPISPLLFPEPDDLLPLPVVFVLGSPSGFWFCVSFSFRALSFLSPAQTSFPMKHADPGLSLNRRVV
jgi:hypothetical protein